MAASERLGVRVESEGAWRFHERFEK